MKQASHLTAAAADPRSAPDDEMFLSIVIPVYRVEKILQVLCERLERALSKLTDRFEMVLVDDRSPDDSWNVLRALAEDYPQMVAVRLSRNFGQPYATTAGLDLARGEWTVVMDCDLQDQPEEIPKLLEKALEGFDIVLARRTRRKDKMLKRLGSYLFWKVFGVLSGSKVDNTVGSFRIMHRRVVDAYCGMRENSRLFGGLVEWLGFSTAYVDVDHQPRYEGKSTYNLRKLLNLAFDGIISFSNRPLYAAIVLGSIMAAGSGIFGAYHLVRYFVFGVEPIAGWLSTVTLTSLIGGLILLNQGIVGLYIGRIYDQSKGRPIYVIDHIVMQPSNTDPEKSRASIGCLSTGLENHG